MFTDEQIAELKKIVAEGLGHECAEICGDIFERLCDPEPSHEGLDPHLSLYLSGWEFIKNFHPDFKFDFHLYRSCLKEAIQNRSTD